MEGDVLPSESVTYVEGSAYIPTEEASRIASSEPRDKTQVEQAMGKLDEYIGITNDLLAKVGQRLELVLRPGGPQEPPSDSVAREVVAAPLADAIDNQARRVGDVNMAVRDLLNRLEV